MINRYLPWALVATVLIALTNTGTIYELTGSEWASWVQAIGSIVAILASVEIFRRQNASLARHAELERLRARMEKQVTAYAVCVFANDMVEELCGAYGFGGTNCGGVSEYFANLYSPSGFDHVIVALGAIPLHELGSYKLTCGVLDLCNAISRADAFCKARGAGPLDVFDTQQETQEAIERISEIGARGFYGVELGVAEARKQVALS